jgi:hypothetical protein
MIVFVWLRKKREGERKKSERGEKKEKVNALHSLKKNIYKGECKPHL